MSNSVNEWSEEARLKAIDSYDILDTPHEEEFDDIVKLAAEACNVPIALISFVTTGRQWLKAGVGTTLGQTGLDSSICSHAILQKDVFVVPDTTEDPRTMNNPLVTGDPKVRFYAGALLESPEGLPLGTVCILDYKPRTLSESEAGALKALARQVMAQLELRETLSKLRRALKSKEESEERVFFLSQLTQTLSMLSRPEEIIRVATQEVGNFLEGNRCYFFEAISPKLHIRVLPDWYIEGETTLQGEYNLSAVGEIELWSLLKFQSVALNDVRVHLWTRRFFMRYQTMNIGAALVAPYCHDGQWLTCLSVSSKEPREWSQDEQIFLEDVMARVWPLVERARIELALRERELELREVNSLLNDRAALLDKIVNQRTQKLSDTIAELEAFSYSISHDMRAPLRSMIGFSQMLLEEYRPKLDSNAVDYLNRICSASHRMDQLIQDVLMFSRLSRHEVTLKVIDAEMLLEEIIKSYPNFDQTVMSVEIQSPLSKVLGNEALLTQCFSNLLENSVKFASPGKKLLVKIWSEQLRSVTRLSFQDNGIGISPNHHTRIFEIFQRVGRDTNGTGIGLAIAKKSVEKMGGSIGLRSALQEGSTFLLDLQSA